MSTGVPSSRKGISSSGSTTETTPLFPCLPLILSPTATFFFIAISTDTFFNTPGSSSFPLRIFISSFFASRSILSISDFPISTIFEISFFTFSLSIELTILSQASGFEPTLTTEILCLERTDFI